MNEIQINISRDAFLRGEYFRVQDDLGRPFGSTYQYDKTETTIAICDAKINSRTSYYCNFDPDKNEAYRGSFDGFFGQFDVVKLIFKN